MKLLISLLLFSTLCFGQDKAEPAKDAPEEIAPVKEVVPDKPQVIPFEKSDDPHLCCVFNRAVSVIGPAKIGIVRTNVEVNFIVKFANFEYLRKLTWERVPTDEEVAGAIAVVKAAMLSKYEAKMKAREGK